MRYVIFLCVALAAGCGARGVEPVATGPAATFVEPRPIAPGRAPGPDEYPPGFDARHYDIRLSLPDAGTRIEGRADIRFAMAAVRPDALALDFTGLTVIGVRVNGAAAATRHDAGKLVIPLARSIAAGDLQVSVDYAGTPDDGLIIRDNVHGHRAVFADNWPNRARFWFPAVDHPADKATASFTIDAPGQWQVIANGVRSGPADGEPLRAGDGSAARRRWRWDIAEPISPYNMVIGAADMDVRTVGKTCVSDRRCIDVTTWMFPEDSARAASSFRRAAEMVDYYSRVVAPFPYGKLAHVQSATRFGGMENATAIFYDQETIAKGRDIEGLVAHETAHQWFGDAVTPADWPHLWLSEGFATYFAALFFEHADGVARLRQMMETDRVRVVASDDVARPVTDASESDLFKRLNTNNYQKGGWVLHMLRGVMGDAAFFDGIRQYYRRHEHGVAETADFRRAMEQAAGKDLGWFFDQWLLRPGFPRLRSAWTWNAGARAADLVVEQTQSAAWPTFRVPLTVEFRTAAADAVRVVIDLDERRETLRVPLPAAPQSVLLDPDGWVLKDVENAGR